MKTAVKIADLLYVQIQNFKNLDYYPWMCIQVKVQYDNLTYEQIEQIVIPEMLARVNIPIVMDDVIARRGIDMSIDQDRYVELVKRGIEATDFATYILQDPISYVPTSFLEINDMTRATRFRPAMALMRAGILAEILDKDPEAVIMVD